jgi:hypothetical protein
MGTWDVRKFLGDVTELRVLRLECQKVKLKEDIAECKANITQAEGAC